MPNNLHMRIFCRDSFIDQKLKPKNKVIKAVVLDFLWSYEDENSQVMAYQ